MIHETTWDLWEMNAYSGHTMTQELTIEELYQMFKARLLREMQEQEGK